LGAHLLGDGMDKGRDNRGVGYLGFLTIEITAGLLGELLSSSTSSSPPREVLRPRACCNRERIGKGLEVSGTLMLDFTYFAVIPKLLSRIFYI
jgi:hypothetical protein